MKKDNLFKHKEVAITCEESMGDTNEYQKLKKPPTKQEEASKGMRTNVIYDQCNKLKHSKEHCHWNPNSPNKKIKNKKEVVVNGVSAQPGNIINKFDNKGGHGKVTKSGSIIYHCFISNSVEHNIYDYPHKDIT